jgi:hypothetical protein
MKTKHLILVGITSILSVTRMLAQPPPPGPPPAALGPAFGATEQIGGTVSMYVVNPRGKIDGLVLNDGTQVKFPPHMSADLARTVKPNDRITAQGVREVAPVFTAFTITNANGQSVNEARPAQPPPPPDLGGVNLQPMQTAGAIRAVLYAPRGEVEGAVLDNGTIVRIAPHASAEFSTLFQPGAAISASGYGTQNEFGRAFEVTQIGANGQALTSVYGSVAPQPPLPPR